MNIHIPREVTVVMPVYNTAAYLSESIESILNQSYEKFYFLILDDGSTDNSPDIIEHYRKKDKRIISFRNDQNLNEPKTRNIGLKIVETKYIALMDSDDISAPNRLELQLPFMKSNRNIGVCGGNVVNIGARSGISNVPCNKDETKASLLFVCPILNNTVIMDMDVIKANNISYNEDKWYGSDLELWHDLKYVTELTNLENVLCSYRIHAENMSVLKNKRTDYDVYDSTGIRRVFHDLNLKATPFNLSLHLNLRSPRYDPEVFTLTDYKSCLSNLIKANNHYNIYPQKGVETIIEKTWDKIFWEVEKKGFKHFMKYLITSGRVDYKHLKFYGSYFKNKLLGSPQNQSVDSTEKYSLEHHPAYVPFESSESDIYD